MEQYEKGFQKFHTSFYFGALRVGRAANPGALPWICHCISTFLTIYPGKVDSISRRWFSKEHFVKAQRSLESICRFSV